MNIINFSEQTCVFAKDQPQYRPLPAHIDKGDPEGRLTCCWSLTWRERLRVLWTGKLWHQVLTFNQPLQPQLLLTEKPPLGGTDAGQAGAALD